MKWQTAPCCHHQELYGGKSTDQLLNALSRLLTHFLQMRGFTCGMDDLYLTAKVRTQKLFSSTWFCVWTCVFLCVDLCVVCRHVCNQALAKARTAHIPYPPPG